MIREYKERYDKSNKEKNDKVCLEKEVQNALEELYEDSKVYLEDSVVKAIELTYDGVNIVLDSSHMNIKMRVNEKDYEQAPNLAVCFGNYEKDETSMCLNILNMLDEDSVCFDIGANVGWYSLNILKKYSKMQVYSFEPSPITFERLKKNFELNMLESTNCYNMGFYMQNGKLDFYFDPEGTGASSLNNIRDRENIHVINVDMMKMDEWIKDKDIDRLDFIKCDVEGAELFVYQGGLETIKKYKPVVFSEMLRKWSAKFGYNPNEIIGLFKEISYSCFVIDDNKYLKKISEVTDETIETNYFFLHKDKHKRIIDILSAKLEKVD